MQPIYLNNAATSWPKPEEVGRAMEKALRSLPGSGNRGGIKSFDVFEQVRRELARVFGVSAYEQIALGCSATWGLNQGIYVRKDISLSPHMVGGTGVLSDLKDMPEQMPLHLEAGTGNEPSYYGLLAALLWSREHSLDKERTDFLAESCRKRLEALGCEVICPKGECTPVVSFTVPGYTPQETGDILSGSYDIICRVGLHCAPDILEDIRKPQGSVRLSFSRFSTEEELDIVLEAVESMRESL